MLSGITSAACEKSYTIHSPDRTIGITLTVGNRIAYEVRVDGRTVVAPTPVAMTLDDGTVWGGSAQPSRIRKGMVDTSFATPFYIKKRVADHYNWLRADFRQGFAIELRAYDDGVAYRFISTTDRSLVVASEDNIAYKAVDLLARKIAHVGDELISVRIEKHIPHEAGLGGGSSDAAAALIGAAKLWGVDPESPEVLEAASELGADVAFFLHGGCTCLTGTGEVFHHALEPMRKTVVLVKPEEGVSTSAAYAAFDESPVTIDPEAHVRALEASRAEEVPLCNNLTAASESLMPELAEMLGWIAAQDGVENSLMSGSGSSAFAICTTFDDACRIVAAARNRGWWARATAFSSAKVSAIPR